MTKKTKMTIEQFKKEHNLKSTKDLRNYLKKQQELGLPSEIMYCPNCHTISNEHEPCQVCFPFLYVIHNVGT